MVGQSVEMKAGSKADRMVEKKVGLMVAWKVE